MAGKWAAASIAVKARGTFRASSGVPSGVVNTRPESPTRARLQVVPRLPLAMRLQGLRPRPGACVPCAGSAPTWARRNGQSSAARASVRGRSPTSHGSRRSTLRFGAAARRFRSRAAVIPAECLRGQTQHEDRYAGSNDTRDRADQVHRWPMARGRWPGNDPVVCQLRVSTKG